MKMGKYKESLNLLEKCLDIYRQSLPANHHLMAHALNNLGIVHSHLEEFDRAREYCEQAWNIQSSSFERTKEQHLLVAISLNNLATLQFEKEDFSGAESSFQRVLELKLAIEGLDSNSHPALENFERTLTIELSIGNAADIAITYNNIGGVYHEQNDFIKAKQFYKKARSNVLTVFSKNHPSVELYKENF